MQREEKDTPLRELMDTQSLWCDGAKVRNTEVAGRAPRAILGKLDSGLRQQGTLKVKFVSREHVIYKKWPLTPSRTWRDPVFSLTLLPTRSSL